MIKLKNGKEVYEIPTSWEEISYKQYKEIQGQEDELKLLSIICNIPIDIAQRLGGKTINRLSMLLSFLNTPINLDGIKCPEYLTLLKGVKIHLVKDIKQKTFGQKIYLHEILKGEDINLIDMLADVILVYSQEQITNKDFDVKKINELNNVFDGINLVSLYATAMQYVDQLKKILEAESNRLGSEPTREQKLAGIDNFQEYGAYATVRSLAGGNWLKMDQVEKMSYYMAFTEMCYNKTQSEFDENYRKVLKNNSK